MTWQAWDAAIRTLTLPVAGGIFLNQLDELFMDANYWLRGLHKRKRRVVPWKALEQVEQKPIAILVPAWQEADVIRHMLEHNLASFDYDRSRYTIFCGTYCNDEATQREVDAIARRFPSVRKVVVPHAGPTSKADCLNWIYQGIVLDEQKRGRRYDILLMHDAEDVIHPLALRLYSLLIPRHDFVQTPVFSLELGLKDGVAATYIDEFAEHHLKDMLVREAIGGLVPSAGVGSAFARDAFEEIARAHGERPFNVESLTEDYEIGLKFRLANKRVHFACRSLELRPSADAPGGRAREELIATREYFPGGFSASVRQRSRWILGITLQTWRQVGWQGSLPVLYCLWRDRKALFTNVLLCLAYLLVAYGAVRLGATALGVAPAIADGVGLPAGVLGSLLTANLAAMAWRALVKAKLVGRLYGWGHALLSVPRMVLGNLIGLCATARAVTMFIKHRVTGKPLRWLKTAHVFPNVEVLRAQRRRLGEILVEQQSLNAAELDDALELQRDLGLPLGRVLSLMGVVSDRDVSRALAQVHDLGNADPAAARLSDRALTLMSEAEAEALDVVPLAEVPGGAIFMAAASPLDADTLRALELRLGRPVEIALAPPDEVRQTRQRGYRRLLSGESAEAVAGAAPTTTLRDLRPDHVDWDAVGDVGAGFCALYAVLPLLPAGAAMRTPTRTVAAAFAVHPRVLAHLTMRLGAPVIVVAAAPFDVDVVLAGMHGVGHGRRGQRTQTFDVLGVLESDAGLDPLAAALARADLLDLPTTVVTPGAIEWPLLPPELKSEPIVVCSVGERSLVLAALRPSPRMNRAVANQYPGWAIAWQVALPESKSLASPPATWTDEAFQLLDAAAPAPSNPRAN